VKSLRDFAAFSDALKKWKGWEGYRDWIGTPQQLVDAIGNYEVSQGVENLELPLPIEATSYLGEIHKLWPDLVTVPVKKLGITDYEQRWFVSSQICSLSLVPPAQSICRAHNVPEHETQTLAAVVDLPSRGELWARFLIAAASFPDSCSWADRMLEEWDERFGAKQDA